MRVAGRPLAPDLRLRGRRNGFWPGFRRCQREPFALGRVVRGGTPGPAGGCSGGLAAAGSATPPAAVRDPPASVNTERKFPKSWSEPLKLDNQVLRFRPLAEHVEPQSPLG